jgi:protein-L-isoaspartate(D-aspartate) O-methyltransferase
VTASEAELTAMRYALVEELQRRRSITDARVAEAFAAVPRHHFLPGVEPERVYSDQAILTKVQDGIGLSSSSQPAMMAIMLQQLLVEPGQRVLEIGAGTGYNAALLRDLVGPRGRVTTVDVDDDIVEGARAHLAAAGCDDVVVILGDGGFGYPAHAPYDRIILTVGAADVLPAWVEQLRPDGLLVLPIQIGAGMYSAALRKGRNGALISESLVPCGFIRLRGVFASGEREVRLGYWTAYVEPGPRLDPDRLPALLDQPGGEYPLPVDVTDALLFLAFSGEPMARLLHLAEPGTDDRSFARDGLIDTAAMSACLLSTWHEPGAPPPASTALLYGSRVAYERLLALLDRWIALGRPRQDDVRLLATPRAAGMPLSGSLTLHRPHAALTLARRDGTPF